MAKISKKPKLNARQIRFVQLVALGMRAGHAYVQAGYRSCGENAASAASRLMRKPVIRKYLAVLRKPAHDATIAHLRKKRAILHDLVMVSPVKGIPGPFSPLEDPKAPPVPLSVKFRAMILDSQLAGEWNP